MDWCFCQMRDPNCAYEKRKKKLLISCNQSRFILHFWWVVWHWFIILYKYFSTKLIGIRKKYWKKLCIIVVIDASLCNMSNVDSLDEWVDIDLSSHPGTTLWINLLWMGIFMKPSLYIFKPHLSCTIRQATQFKMSKVLKLTPFKYVLFYRMIH